MKCGAAHDVGVPNFKRLKWVGFHEAKIAARLRIKEENAATREVHDSWADIARENELKKRRATIKDMWEKKK